MNINLYQILFQLINFGVVFGALTYFLYKPLLKVIDDRRAKTEEAEKIAEATIREKEEIEALKKKAKSQAEKDAVKFLEEAREEAKALKTKLSKEVKEEVVGMRAKEVAKIESEGKAQLAKMEEEVARLSVAIAAKIMGTEVDEKTHKALISSSIKELAKAV